MKQMSVERKENKNIVKVVINGITKAYRTSLVGDNKKLISHINMFKLKFGFKDKDIEYNF